MPARSSSASGARTGLLAMPSPFTRTRVSVASPQKVWIIDDFLQWSNLAYLAVSRVEYLSQLEREVCPPPPPPPEEGSQGARTLTEQQLRKVIQRKLMAYKRQDQAKGLRFSLKVDHILALKEAQNNRRAACNIERLWAYQPKETLISSYY